MNAMGPSTMNSATVKFATTFGCLCLVLAPLVRAAEPTAIAPIMQPFVDKQFVAGAVTLVVDKDSTLALDSVGYASLRTRRPMRSDDLFWIASMTKPITATALMMLVDEGKVNLADPVEKYLPEFKGQLVADGSGPPHAPSHPITVREIMSHTSGLVRASDPVFRNTNTLADWVARCGKTPLIREPGTKYEYNNSGINTGGRIIEVVSGLPYADFMRRRIFDPLGMKDTTFWPTEAQAARLARTARRSKDSPSLEEIQLAKNVTPALIERLGRGTKVPAPMLDDMGIGQIANYTHHFTEPAGGLYSTAPDLGNFCQMLLGGGVYRGRRLLSEEALRAMTSNQTGKVPVSPEEGYGIGWSVKTRDTEGPSVGSFGHRGARRTAMWIDANNGIAMIVLIERFDMTGKEQNELYRTFLKTAIAKYAKPKQ
jgi:CubicO group peptidase (beta-lactamase class C family)